MLPTPDYERVKKCWLQIPNSYPEPSLEPTLVQQLLEGVGLNINQIVKKAISGGVTPDRLLYIDPAQPPVVVVENKKRDGSLAVCPDESFEADVLKSDLYIHATEGLQTADTGKFLQRGIKQYLDTKHVPPSNLASFGMVFNGDFIQFWRRVDGLVLPLSPIQRMKEETIPSLMDQLQYLLKAPQRALVTAIWNQKGGVSKTTNTINLGAVLAIQSKRVLLIDADEQNDLSRGVGLIPESLESWFEDCVKLLQKNELAAAKEVVKQVIHHRLFPGSSENYFLDVLPISAKDIKNFRENRDIPLSTKIKVFRSLIDLLAGSFDYIFIDTSPAFDVLTRCILFSVDTVLIPVDYGRKSLYHGVNIYNHLGKFRAQRAGQEKLYFGPWNLGLLFSNCPPDAGVRLHELIEGELESRDFQGRRCNTRIKTFAQTKIAEFKGVPVACWQNSPVTQLYMNLADELFLNHNFINE